jgi:hypothetical protein
MIYFDEVPKPLEGFVVENTLFLRPLGLVLLELLQWVGLRVQELIVAVTCYHLTPQSNS